MLFNRGRSREVSLHSFQWRFYVELSLMNYPYQKKICGDELFQGSTSLKIARRYRMGAVTLHLFPGYSLRRTSRAHSGFWSHFMLAVKLPRGRISSPHYVVNVPVNMKDWHKSYIFGIILLIKPPFPELLSKVIKGVDFSHVISKCWRVYISMPPDWLSRFGHITPQGLPLRVS